jgi:hypothetical protein
MIRPNVEISPHLVALVCTVIRSDELRISWNCLLGISHLMTPAALLHASMGPRLNPFVIKIGLIKL